jgi:hypothetical protein
MARVTYVKKAQQRYEQKPVIDPATGQQKRTPVISKRTGEQKVSKRGPQFLRVTEDDKTKPLPPYTCGYCSKPIEIGTPYKHISPKSGPYGGATLRRHAECPTWQVWDYSSSLSARTAQIAYEGMNAITSAIESREPSEVEAALSSIADEIRSLAEEKREGASNIEDGFGHPTQQSEELEQIADDLDSWADDVEGAEVPEAPEPEEGDCDQCDGTGEVEDEDSKDEEGNPLTQSCDQCEGTGQHTPDEPTDEQWEEWANEVESNVSIVDECPV